MPRAGWVKPESDRRLSDLVSVGVLTRVFPPGLVDEVIAVAGRTELRNRSLPARVMAYFAIGMALYSEGSYEDVLGQLSDGLAWSSGWEEEYALPSKSAIFQARARLGREPVQALFERVARPIGAPTVGGRHRVVGRAPAGRGRRDVSGCGRHRRERGVLRPARGEQGRAGRVPAGPGGRVGRVRHPCHVRRVVGPLTTGEPTMIEQLLPEVEPGMLLLADRGVFSYALWRKASATGADLLWRIRTDRAGPQPSHLEDLPDGSWLAELRRSTGAAERAKPSDDGPGDRLHDRGRSRHPTATGCSPRSSTPPRQPRPSWPPPTTSGGRSSWPSTS